MTVSLPELAATHPSGPAAIAENSSADAPAPSRCQLRPSGEPEKTNGILAPSRKSLPSSAKPDGVETRLPTVAPAASAYAATDCRVIVTAAGDGLAESAYLVATTAEDASGPALESGEGATARDVHPETTSTIARSAGRP